jgi:hypothetical protein
MAQSGVALQRETIGDRWGIFEKEAWRINPKSKEVLLKRLGGLFGLARAAFKALFKHSAFKKRDQITPPSRFKKRAGLEDWPSSSYASTG